MLQICRCIYMLRHYASPWLGGFWLYVLCVAFAITLDEKGEGVTMDDMTKGEIPSVSWDATACGSPRLSWLISVRTTRSSR